MASLYTEDTFLECRRCITTVNLSTQYLNMYTINIILIVRGRNERVKERIKKSFVCNKQKFITMITAVYFQKCA
jgi:hypothetical protein